MLSASLKVTVFQPQPKASVIIPVHNSERTLGRCLAAVFASQGIGEFEVIVVDDGSTDSSAEVASSFPCKVIRCHERRGPSIARNRGVLHARTPRLVFVDSDVVVRPDSLELLVDALDSSAAVFATYDPEPLNKNFATLLYHSLSCRSLQDTSESTSVFYSYCAAIWKDLFLELGGFDTNFTRATFEDVELGRQFASRGLYSRHLRNVRVFHDVRYGLLNLARAYFHKSHDLALLLLSHRTITFGDQGWTSRKNWPVLASAWGTLILGLLALFVQPLWAVAWLLAVGGFLAASAPLYRSMARERWFYGPLGVLGYFAIHCIATCAMVVGAFHCLRAGVRVPAPALAGWETDQENANSPDLVSVTADRPHSVEQHPVPRSKPAKSAA